jgi:hypothetical protein
MWMLIRFVGSIVIGVLISLVFVGIGVLYRPFDPLDTWGDVWRLVLSCGVIGFFGGAIVGTFWCAFEAERRVSIRRNITINPTDSEK